MAKDNAKKAHKANKGRLFSFRLTTAVINFATLLLGMYADGGTVPSYGTIALVVFWASQEVLALMVLQQHGAPELNEAGDITSCVDLADPNQLGICSYAQDLLWVCWAVQALTTFVSVYFWVLYSVVPIFVAYKAVTLVVWPLLQNFLFPSGSQGEPVEDNDPRAKLRNRRNELRGSRKNSTQEDTQRMRGRHT